MAAAAAEHFADRSTRQLRGERPAARVLRYFVVAADLAVLMTAIALGELHVQGQIGTLVVWGILIAAAGSFTVSSGDASLGFDLPLLLGAGLVLGAVPAGILGLVAVSDVREFRLEIPAGLSLFNRAQISLSVMAGSAIFHATGATLGDWPWTAVAGVLALVVDTLVNYGIVGAYWAIQSNRSFLLVAAGMRFGRGETFIPLYACFGFMGVLLAETYARLGLLGLAAFVAPVLVARQAFAHSRLLEDATRSLVRKDRALRAVDARVSQERRDERMVLAGELHDEVLPPLFQVTLMGHVLKQDLATGRLLDLDEDLPQLLAATEAAQVALRELVRGLRKSSLGAGGLVPTIRVLAKQLESSGGPRISLDLHEVAGTEQASMLAYQVAREAITNASRYSRAKSIEVRLGESEGVIRVVIVDDGVGFDPLAVDQEEHFGLQLIAERVESAGGSVVIDSRLGAGTMVAASVPMDFA